MFIGDHTKQLKLPSKVLPQDTPYSMKKKLTQAGAELGQAQPKLGLELVLSNLIFD